MPLQDEFVVKMTRIFGLGACIDSFQYESIPISCPSVEYGPFPILNPHSRAGTGELRVYEEQGCLRMEKYPK
jgi:hypothetical protein